MADMPQKDFPRRLEAALAEAGINQTELAKRAKIDRGQISHYVNGHVYPEPATIAKMARALGCSVASLIGNGDDNHRPKIAIEYRTDGTARLIIDAVLIARDAISIAEEVANKKT